MDQSELEQTMNIDKIKENQENQAIRGRTNEDDDNEEFQSMVEEEDEEAEYDHDDSDDPSSDEERGVALMIDRNQLSGDNVAVPQNGHDYLNAVRAERASLPSVVTVPLAPEKKQRFQKKLEMSGRTRIGFPKNRYIEYHEGPHSGSSEELNYRDEILNNFKTLRAQIDEIRGSNYVSGVKIDDCNNVDDVQISEKEIKQQQDSAERRAENLVKLMELGQRPQVTSLINCSQLELHMTLERLADQCDITPNHSTIHSDWLYSIMAALRDPIEPDICSTLRRIARICINKRELLKKKRDRAKQSADKTICQEAESRRNKENGPSGQASPAIGSVAAGGEDNGELVRKLEEEEYTSSLLIICIVRHYFGQVDLR